MKRKVLLLLSQHIVNHTGSPVGAYKAPIYGKLDVTYYLTVFCVLKML